MYRVGGVPQTRVGLPWLCLFTCSARINVLLLLSVIIIIISPPPAQLQQSRQAEEAIKLRTSRYAGDSNLVLCRPHKAGLYPPTHPSPYIRTQLLLPSCLSPLGPFAAKYLGGKKNRGNGVFCYGANTIAFSAKNVRIRGCRRFRVDEHFLPRSLHGWGDKIPPGKANKQPETVKIMSGGLKNVALFHRCCAS